MKYWFTKVGSKIQAAALSEDQFVALACSCIVHACAVNRGFFEGVIDRRWISVLDMMSADIENVSRITELPLMKLEQEINQIMPSCNSDESVVPGWVALIDAFTFLIDYKNERGDESQLMFAVASSYSSVSNRGCAQVRGVAGNCSYEDLEWELEQADPYCDREIAYQITALSRIEDA